MLDASIGEPKVTVRELFPVPVAVCQWPDTERLNKDLREAILTRYRSSAGVVNSNRRGWHSNFDLHTWPEPCIAEFLAMVRLSTSELVARMTSDRKFLDNWQVQIAWANVNPRGGHNRSHNHLDEGAHLSGFYYVDLGACETPGDSGRTIFEDRSGVAHPTPPGRDLRSREYALDPKPGTMALFPASQFHHVEPYRGAGVRITIAFNLCHPEFSVLYYPGMRDEGWWWTNFRGLMVLRSKIPEKLHALALLASYAFGELRSARTGSSLRGRFKVLYERASVDASAAREAKQTVSAASTAIAQALSEKRSLV